MNRTFPGHSKVGNAAILAYMKGNLFRFDGKAWQVASCIAIGDDVKVEMKEVG